MATRARSADRGPTPAEARMEQLAEAMQALINRPRPFKPPTFDGHGDVEFFIQQFLEVSQANRWTPVAALLHLRESLQGETKECGKSADVASVCGSLRARYGMTVREARTLLTNLRKDQRTTLHDHATTVRRLVSVAYADLPQRNQEDMRMDRFLTTLGHAPLQRHMLAVNPLTLDEAVRTGNDFLQIRTLLQSSVNQVEGPSTPPEPETPETPEIPQAAALTPGHLEAIMQQLQALTTEVAALKRQQAPVWFPPPQPKFSPRPLDRPASLNSPQLGAPRAGAANKLVI